MQEEPPDAGSAVAPVRRHRVPADAHGPRQTRSVLECRDRVFSDPASGLLGDASVPVVSRRLEEVEESVGDSGGAVGVPERGLAAEVAIARRNYPGSLAWTGFL